MLEKDRWRSKESTKDREVLGQFPSESWVLSVHAVSLFPLPLVPPHRSSRVVSMTCQGLPSDPDQTELHQL